MCYYFLRSLLTLPFFTIFSATTNQKPLHTFTHNYWTSTNVFISDIPGLSSSQQSFSFHVFLSFFLHFVQILKKSDLTFNVLNKRLINLYFQLEIEMTKAFDKEQFMTQKHVAFINKGKAKSFFSVFSILIPFWVTFMSF